MSSSATGWRRFNAAYDIVERSPLITRGSQTAPGELAIAVSGSAGAFTTQRLILRMADATALETLAALANDRRIVEALAGAAVPYWESDPRTWRISADAAVIFMISLRDGTPIGAFDLTAGEEESASEINFWLTPTYWGQGYATEAMHAAVDYAFEEFMCDKIASRVRVSMPGGRRVLEKCGFQWVGVGLFFVEALRSSAPCDRFELDRRVWESLKAWKTASRAEQPLLEAKRTTDDLGRRADELLAQAASKLALTVLHAETALKSRRETLIDLDATEQKIDRIQAETSRVLENLLRPA